MDVEPFTIAVADEVLSDLRTRLLDTRWPEAAPGPPWQQGTDLAIPSLPGYGFSQRPHRTGVTSRFTAGLWHHLMRGLGYERYGAHGADWGAAVSTFMALDEPGPMIGLHLANLDSAPYTGPGSRPLSDAERAYVADFQRWLDEERAYGAIQSTRPQSLAYGLNDSPAALAGWILEKWRLRGDTGGDIESRFSRDFLLANVTLYWATATIVTSMRDYFDNRCTPMPRGGHFPAAEEPELLAADIAAFFTELAG